VYAHSRDTLFTFDPVSRIVTRIGLFALANGTAAPYMLDLAVNAVGSIYTASDDTLFSVDPMTASVTPIAQFGLGTERLFALTFLVPGEYDASGETLIGATNEGAYYRVDPTTAQTTYLGTYPDRWLSSGDIVSIEGLGTFATVRRTDFPSDVLVEIRFAADGSSTTRVIGPIQDGSHAFRQIFGVGYWGRAIYGFSNAGELIEIDRATGAGALVETKTGTNQFWGAGVTTVAPVLL